MGASASAAVLLSAGDGRGNAGGSGGGGDRTKSVGMVEEAAGAATSGSCDDADGSSGRSGGDGGEDDDSSDATPRPSRPTHRGGTSPPAVAETASGDENNGGGGPCGWERHVLDALEGICAGAAGGLCGFAEFAPRDSSSARSWSSSYACCGRCGRCNDSSVGFEDVAVGGGVHGAPANDDGLVGATFREVGKERGESNGGVPVEAGVEVELSAHEALGGWGRQAGLGDGIDDRAGTAAATVRDLRRRLAEIEVECPGRWKVRCAEEEAAALRWEGSALRRWIDEVRGLRVVAATRAETDTSREVAAAEEMGGGASKNCGDDDDDASYRTASAHRASFDPLLQVALARGRGVGEKGSGGSRPVVSVDVFRSSREEAWEEDASLGHSSSFDGLPDSGEPSHSSASFRSARSGIDDGSRTSSFHPARLGPESGGSVRSFRSARSRLDSGASVSSFRSARLRVDDGCSTSSFRSARSRPESGCCVSSFRSARSELDDGRSATSFRSARSRLDSGGSASSLRSTRSRLDSSSSVSSLRSARSRLESGGSVSTFQSARSAMVDDAASTRSCRSAQSMVGEGEAKSSAQLEQLSLAPLDENDADDETGDGPGRRRLDSADSLSVASVSSFRSARSAPLDDRGGIWGIRTARSAPLVVTLSSFDESDCDSEHDVGVEGGGLGFSASRRPGTASCSVAASSRSFRSALSRPDDDGCSVASFRSAHSAPPEVTFASYDELDSNPKNAGSGDDSGSGRRRRRRLGTCDSSLATSAVSFRSSRSKLDDDARSMVSFRIAQSAPLEVALASFDESERFAKNGKGGEDGRKRCRRLVISDSSVANSTGSFRSARSRLEDDGCSATSFRTARPVHLESAPTTSDELADCCSRIGEDKEGGRKSCPRVGTGDSSITTSTRSFCSALSRPEDDRCSVASFPKAHSAPLAPFASSDEINTKPGEKRGDWSGNRGLDASNSLVTASMASFRIARSVSSSSPRNYRRARSALVGSCASFRSAATESDGGASFLSSTESFVLARWKEKEEGEWVGPLCPGTSNGSEFGTRLAHKVKAGGTGAPHRQGRPSPSPSVAETSMSGTVAPPHMVARAISTVVEKDQQGDLKRPATAAAASITAPCIGTRCGGKEKPNVRVVDPLCELPAVRPLPVAELDRNVI